MILLKIIVIDAQGGGMGKIIIEKIKQNIPKSFILAIGTNALATSNMLKAGANAGATGENAIIYNSRECSSTDIITGAIGLILSNSMYGEITSNMSKSIGESKAYKILIPVSKCKLYICGNIEKPLIQYIEEAVEFIKDLNMK